MATQTFERVDSIEHLEHEVMCEGRCHVGPAARADFYVDQHGCDDFLLCAPCLQEANAGVESWLAAGDTITCNVCNHTFTSLKSVITSVRPL
jgi:hypothetical protein